MNIHNLSEHTKRDRIAPNSGAATTWLLAAGTTDVSTATIDTRGYEGVLIRYGMGIITSGAVTDIKLTHSSDDSSYSDVAGTAQTIADTESGKVFEIEVWKPTKRYLRVAINRGTQNAVVDFVEAILYNPHHGAPTQGTTVSATERFNSPISGTA